MGNEGFYIVLCLAVILFLPLAFLIQQSIAIRQLQREAADAKTARPSVENKNEVVTATPSRQQQQEQDNNNWRCVCETGFLPPGMFGNAEAVLRMGSGQCYHKQT